MVAKFRGLKHGGVVIVVFHTRGPHPRFIPVFQSAVHTRVSYPSLKRAHLDSRGAFRGVFPIIARCIGVFRRHDS